MAMNLPCTDHSACVAVSSLRRRLHRTHVHAHASCSFLHASFLHADGANPFQVNTHDISPIEAALVTGQAALLRVLERHCMYAGEVCVKVSPCLCLVCRACPRHDMLEHLAERSCVTSCFQPG